MRALGSVFDGVTPHVYQNCFPLSMVFHSHRSDRIPGPQPLAPCQAELSPNHGRLRA